MGEPVVHGRRAGNTEPIDSIDDSGTERLAVDAKLTSGFVAEVNLDETSDEVAVYGGVNGSETADAATRQILNVSSAGVLRIEGADAEGATATSQPILVAGQAIGANVNLVLATDSSGRQIGVGAVAAGSAIGTSSPVMVAGSDGTLVRRILTDSSGAVAIQDNSGSITVDDGAGSLTVDNTTLAVVGGGTEATALRVTIATDSTGLVSVDDNGGSLTVDNAALSVVGGGTEAAAQRVTIANDSTGVLSVDDNGGSLTVDANNLDIRDLTSASDSVAVLQATASNLNAEVQGDAAHDAPISGNPVRVGARAIAHGTNPTAVAAGDATDIYANRAGVPFVMGGHPNIRSTEYHWTTAAQTNDDMLGTIATGAKVVVTGITVTISEATTVGVKVRVGFGTASVPTEAAGGGSVEGVIFSHGSIVPGGGASRGDGSGILGIGADGEELRITAGACTGGEGHAVVTWYTIES